jgi:hypothetical protein
MPCPTEEELYRQPCYPTKVYPQQIPCQGYPQPQPPYQQQVQSCQPCVKVRVMKSCGGQWTLAQEMTLNSAPQVGTSIVIDGGSFKIESLMLLGNNGGYDTYEALVTPALQGSYQVGPWTSKNDCGCQQKPKSSCGCGGSSYKPSGCGCQEPVNKCNPCEKVPYPVYALRGYPW